MTTLTLPRERHNGTPTQGYLAVAQDVDRLPVLTDDSFAAAPMDKQAKKDFARQIAQEAMDSPAVRGAQRVLLGVAVTFEKAGLLIDARTVLMTALQIALRHHFVLVTGRRDAAGKTAQQYTQKLRAAKALDRPTCGALLEVCRERPPYSELYLARLLAIVRKVQVWTYGE